MKPQITQISQIGNGNKNGEKGKEVIEHTKVAHKDPKTYAVMGAAMEVHRVLGPGFLEAVYKDALEREFRLRNIPYQREVELPVMYKGEALNTSYRADFVCLASVITEAKALSKLTPVDEAQTINYLKATGFEVGLLLNFGEASLKHRRFIYSKSRDTVKEAFE